MKKSLSALAKQYGTTTPSLRAWVAEGVDIHDPKALAARIARKQPCAPTAAGSATQAAKLRKLTAEAQLAEIRAAQAEGKLIALDDVCTILLKIGHSLKAQLGKLRAELPPTLYGMNQHQMSRAIAEATDRTLQAICDQLDRVKTEPPRPE
jgi:transposase-like protein